MTDHVVEFVLVVSKPNFSIRGNHPALAGMELGIKDTAFEVFRGMGEDGHCELLGHGQVTSEVQDRPVQVVDDHQEFRLINEDPVESDMFKRMPVQFDQQHFESVVR
jgi:hypothetical protein